MNGQIETKLYGEILSRMISQAVEGSPNVVSCEVLPAFEQHPMTDVLVLALPKQNGPVGRRLLINELIRALDFCGYATPAELAMCLHAKGQSGLCNTPLK